MRAIKIFSREDIECIVPHRFENVLADSVTMGELDGVRVGLIELLIHDDDQRGRAIFSKHKTLNQSVVLPAVFLEILALGAIVCTDRPHPDLPVFFTGISRFVKHQDFCLGETAKGLVKKVKDKAGFIVCDAELSSERGLICTATLMAFFPSFMPKKIEKNARKMSEFDCPKPIYYPLKKWPTLKSPFMYMCDALRYVNLNEGIVVGDYTSPENHPLIKGHFPGNPILMGVLQWMSVEDLVLALATYLKETEGKVGRYVVRGDAELIHDDGGVVADIKGFQVQVWMSTDDCLDQAELIATEKVSFRDSVKPSQTISIVCRHLVIG